MIVYQEVLDALRRFEYEKNYKRIKVFVSTPQKAVSTREAHLCVFYSPVVWKERYVWVKK